MFKYFIFFILLCANFIHALKKCDDCIAFTSCPDALASAKRHKNPTKFQTAYCGMEISPNNKTIPKMCCSDFADSVVTPDLPIRITEEGYNCVPYTECDCVAYTACPKALEVFQQRKNQKLFKSSICGYDNSGPQRVSKVYCSAFDEVPIERHPNIHLLLKTDCGGINGQRIVGGTIARLYEFPWMALISIQKDNTKMFGCGATIINSRYVLTAAHCVVSKTILGVRVGEHDLLTKYDCQNDICESHIKDIPVERNIVHPDYVAIPDAVNDIALLRVKEPIDFSHQNVAPVCLPLTENLRNKYLANEKALVSGWGKTENGRDSHILRKTEIPILERIDCLKKLESDSGESKFLDVNQICAGEPRKDSCTGDSGGPLMVESEYQGAYRIVQYGIVSKGPRQCGSGTPAVYTDVSKYMKWILDNITE